MTITDASRYHLHQRLDAVLGSEEASVLMEHLPPVGWADVARRSDVDHLETVSRLDLANAELRLRTELERVDHAIRADLASLEQGIRRDMAAMEQGIRADLASVDQRVADLRVELHRELHAMQARLFGAFLALASVLIALSVFRG